MNIRVADIHACYKLWKSRGAEFITEPMEKYGEWRCYIRDPDGYLIEVGQSTERQVWLILGPDGIRMERLWLVVSSPSVCGA